MLCKWGKVHTHTHQKCLVLLIEKQLRNGSLLSPLSLSSASWALFTCRHKQKAALRGQRGDFIGEADVGNQSREKGKRKNKTGKNFSASPEESELCEWCPPTDVGSPHIKLFNIWGAVARFNLVLRCYIFIDIDQTVILVRWFFFFFLENSQLCYQNAYGYVLKMVMRMECGSASIQVGI